MSLHVYLAVPGTAAPTGSGIFIREDGKQRELTREEWDERYPGQEPVRFIQEGETDVVYHGNLTHNLVPMARQAGLYLPLWCPEELSITRAELLVRTLDLGLNTLLKSPERFRPFNPENGWGTYEGLVAFVEDYLAACRRWPQAVVSVSV